MREFFYLIRCLIFIRIGIVYLLSMSLQYLKIYITNKNIRYFLKSDDILIEMKGRLIINKNILFTINENNLLKVDWYSHTVGIWMNPITNWKERYSMIKDLGI